MTLSLVTAPGIEPISLQEAKDHLRVTHAVEDALIDQLIVAARQHIDGRDGWLGRQLITAIWDLTLDRFPAADYISLPLPPVQSITSITYIDDNGTQQTLSSAKYVLSAGKHWRPRADLAYDEIWPTTRDQPGAVTVRIVCGYGSNPADVPASITAALKIMIGDLYENRQSVVIGQSVAEIPRAADALLAPYRVWV